MSAIKSGAPAHSTEDARTAYMTGTLFTKVPVKKFSAIPTIMLGRILSDA